METTESARNMKPQYWVLVTLAVGVVAGILLSGLPPLAGPGPGHFPGPRLESHADYDVVLSSVGISLVGALLVVYLRTYSQTQAKFAFGLVFVLAALLMQSVLTSPLLLGAFGHPLGNLGLFLLVADVFKVAALTVFLYLSLQ